MINFIENFIKVISSNELKIERNLNKWRLWARLKFSLSKDESAKIKTKNFIKIKSIKTIIKSSKCKHIIKLDKEMKITTKERFKYSLNLKHDIFVMSIASRRFIDF